jgi:putative endonuclease
VSHSYAVYILASGTNGTLYIGVTGDLERRVAEHRDGAVPGFTRRYGVKRLIHYEQFGDVNEAIAREKQLKKWNRAWKLNLIERDNPHWDDLAAAWFAASPFNAVIPAKAGTHIGATRMPASGSPPPRG